MPRKIVAGRFGKSTTLPSGCTKNLTRSPGFNRRCSRIAFGIVAWPFVVIADSMIGYHYICQNVILRTFPCVKRPIPPPSLAVIGGLTGPAGV
jgi:hypothetical protein